MSFFDQISFDLNKRTNTYARRVNKQFTEFANVYVFYNTSKSNRRVNSCAIYIVVQKFALKRSLFDITLFANNRDSSNIQILFANSNDAKEEFKSNLQSRRFFVQLFDSISLYIYLSLLLYQRNLFVDLIVCEDNLSFFLRSLKLHRQKILSRITYSTII